MNPLQVDSVSSSTSNEAAAESSKLIKSAPPDQASDVVAAVKDEPIGEELEDEVSDIVWPGVNSCHSKCVGFDIELLGLVVDAVVDWHGG